MRKLLIGAGVVLFIVSCPKGTEMKGIRAPEIQVTSEEAWINSRPLSMKELRGKVVLIDIWDYTCVNCIRTLPYIKSWHERYSRDGLVIIGVHAPEFEFARLRDNVQKAVDDFGLTYPVVMDNDYRIWTSYANSYWPRKYLIDKDGYIRYDHIGEGGYEETEKKIQELLVEIDPGLEFPEPLADTSSRDAQGKVCYPMTPELYMGFQRGRIGNREGFKPNGVVDYGELDSLTDGFIYLRGSWRNLAEAMVHARRTSDLQDYVGIAYHAIEVNAVIKPETGESYEVWIKQDDEWLSPEDAGPDINFTDDGKSYLTISEPRMYRIVFNSQYGHHRLKLYSTSDGFGIYAFTFGACQ